MGKKKVFYEKKYSQHLDRNLSSRLKMILISIGDQKASAILDVGCGDGSFSVFLKEMAEEVYGVDISLNAVNLAKEKGIKAHTIDIDDVDLPFEDDYFDIVVCGEADDEEVRRLVLSQPFFDDDFPCEGQFHLARPGRMFECRIKRRIRRPVFTRDRVWERHAVVFVVSFADRAIGTRTFVCCVGQETVPLFAEIGLRQLPGIECINPCGQLFHIIITGGKRPDLILKPVGCAEFPGRDDGAVVFQ